MPGTAQPDDGAPGAAPMNSDDLLAALAGQVQDLTRVVTRQAAALDRLVAADRARSGPRTEAKLINELFAVFVDADLCVRSAESEREARAFTALRDGLERLIAGAGGTVVAPRPGDPFDVTVMEASDVTPIDGTPAVAETVADVIRPGLTIAGRSVRPALVVVYVG